MNFTAFQVGEKFPLPIQNQGEGGMFQYDCNGKMFILRLKQNDIIAAEAFRTGSLELGLYEEQGILFFLYKIDGIFNAWGDCPFHASYLNPNQLLGEQEDLELDLFLVDARLDLLLATRKVYMSEKFVTTLRQSYQKQLKSPLTKQAYIEKVNAIWHTRTSDQMAAKAVCREVFAMTLQSS